MDTNLDVLSSVSKNDIFSGLSQDETASLLRGRIQTRSFQKGEVIYGPEHFWKSLGFLVKGCAQVTKEAQDAGAVLLNVLRPPALFGAAAVFYSSETYVTTVRAKTDCTVCFVDEKDVEAILRENFIAAKNYISFLTDRVNFLNRRLDCFTLGTVEERVAYYLCENWALKGAEIGLSSTTALASMLGVSRASLYRVLEQLEGKGIIRKRGKKIFILDAKRLMAGRSAAGACQIEPKEKVESEL